MENELTFNEYLSILKRRWTQILTAFLILLAILAAVIFSLPFVYKAEGHIAIESPVVPDEVVKTTSPSKYVDESVDKVKQKVFDRENLIKLNQKYNLYPGLKEEKELVKALTNNITFTSETRDSSSNTWDSQKITVGLYVGFKYSDPETTYKVANDIIKQLIEENEKSRTQQATETTNFLTNELERMRDDLEAVENKVAAYKQKHANSLPEHQEMHMSSLEQLRTALKDVDREYKSTQEELRYLDVEYTTTSASLGDGIGGPSQVTKISELEKARAELDKALVQYKETHPTIKSLKRKVALLEKSQTAPVEEKKPVIVNPQNQLALAKIKTKIATAETRLESLEAQKRSMNNQIAALQNQILLIPQVERGLSTLLRDYANAKAKYEDVKAKQINAKIAQNLAMGDKGERFILKESPEYPKYRESPKRTLLMALAFLVSLILGFAYAIVSEMLDPRVRGQGAVTSIVNTKLLAVIPYIETQAEHNKKKRVIKTLSVISILIVLLAAAAAIVHFFVTPLDTLIAGVK